MRWLILWIGAATTITIGVLLLYLGPEILPAGKGFAPPPFLAQAPLAVIAIGILGMAAGSVGIVVSQWRARLGAPADPNSVRRGSDARGHPGSDSVAFGALIVASAALLAVVLIEFAWPRVVATMPAGPCDQNPTVACFRAHPDFYQETSPGSGGYSTPVSRIGDNVLTPVMLGAWPLGLAAAVTSVIALGTGTRRRRIAVIGAILGSITVVGMAAQYLAFLVIGGGD